MPSSRLVAFRQEDIDRKSVKLTKKEKEEILKQCESDRATDATIALLIKEFGGREV